MKEILFPYVDSGNNTNKRIDFFFSYWIDAWCVLYILYDYNKSKRENIFYNPKFALLIAIFMNVLEFISMIYFRNNINHIIIYTIIVGIGKGLPLFFLWNTQIHRYDIYTTFILFFIYLLWLYLHNVTLYEYIIQAYQNVRDNKPVGPITKYFMNQ